MDTSRALEIIKSPSDGIDPYTGEVFPTGRLYQHPDTVRALFKAIGALEGVREKKKRKKTRPEKAGMPWRHEEDALLAEAFDKGASIKELSDSHMRTEAAIKSRLIRLGKIEI
jgi:hypothetical protein